MAYKIYNILTDKSFHARLLDLQYQDSSGKKKTITEHAFLLEGVKEMAKRNNCIEWTKGNLQTESTQRDQMIFQKAKLLTSTLHHSTAPT
jgi:hypothetical protein